MIFTSLGSIFGAMVKDCGDVCELEQACLKSSGAARAKCIGRVGTIFCTCRRGCLRQKKYSFVHAAALAGKKVPVPRPSAATCWVGRAEFRRRTDCLYHQFYCLEPLTFNDMCVYNLPSCLGHVLTYLQV